MATRVSARGMVGRSSELAELEAALSEAATGSPSIAFVAGESGLGKTRLLDELAQRARLVHGARVLSGDCVELGDGELPYAPLVTALRPLARTGDPVLDTLSSAVRADLGTIALGLAPDSATGVATRDADAPPQARLFEALLTLLAALSEETPLLLIIEDLHWADRSTRSFLTFLAANLCREQVLVVGSYRPDELHRRHPLRPLLAELERDSRARRIELSPMSRAELALQLADILGAEPDDDLVDRMYMRSEGNPLFCEELLATGMDGRGSLPSTLRDALMVRVQRLEAPAQQVLRLVAVARTLDHATLAATGEVQPDVLREAIEGHILITNLDGDYAFRHALLREVVDDDLLPGERSALHHKLALALEAATGKPTAQRLAHIAHHYAQSGDQTAALVSAVKAAQAAMPVHAYGEAAALFERALELWAHVPDAAGLAGIDLIAVLELTADAHDMDGNNVREETLLSRALGLAEDSGDARRTAGLLEQLSRAQWTLNCQDESLETLDRAMALMPDEPSQDRAWLLASKARYLMLMGRSRSAVDAGQAALDEAVPTGARRAQGRAANALGVSLMSLGDVEAGVAALRSAVTIAREDNHLPDLSRGLVNLADVLHLAGRTKEALQVALDGHVEIAVVGRESIWLGLTISELAFDDGDWELATKWLPDTRRRAQGTTLVNLLLRRAELSLGRGEHDAARDQLNAADIASEGSREPQFIGVLGALRAEYERRAGDLDAARAAVEDALDRIEFCTDDVHRIARVATVGVKVEADAAQQARDLGDGEAERAAIARAGGLLDRVRAASEGDRPVEIAYLHTALAEAQRAAGQDDPALWRTAISAWEEIERPYLIAQTRARQAEAYVTASDRDNAAIAATAALDAALSLGADWLAADVQGLIDRARLRVSTAAVPAEPEATDAPAGDDADPFGLTAREQQVLALVARGATNREIGGELFMAEKTASVHVSRILAKLDVRSRTEAAAVAHRLGLYDA